MTHTSKFCKYSGDSCHETYYNAWQNDEEQKYNELLKKCYYCPVSYSKNKTIIDWHCKNHIHKIGEKYLCDDHTKLVKKNVK